MTALHRRRSRRCLGRARRIIRRAPVKIIVPFPAGGTADVVPRIVGRLALAQMGPAGHHREPAGRRRQYRRRARLQGRARRLHAAVGAAAAAGHQPEPLSEAQLRSERIRADHLMARIPNALVVTPKFAAEDRRRVDRLRQGQSGQDQFGDPGQRHDLASHVRDVPDDGGGEIPARALYAARRRRSTIWSPAPSTSCSTISAFRSRW